MGASQIRASASGFQCSRVGSPATWGRSSSAASARTAFLLLEAVDRRLMGRPVCERSKLSVLPWTLRGGVRGAGRRGFSVGRSAAGIYMGDLGGRSCRVASGRFGNIDALRGEDGDWSMGVPDAESMGENCWVA
jgi:hypothetical protein